MKFSIINGPNLNLVGEREPEIYGNQSLQDYFVQLQERFAHLTLEMHQSNLEGELVELIQKLDSDGLVINAGGYAHTSVAIRDAVAALQVPRINVHISNPESRESFRQQDLLTGVCSGYIGGLGLEGYAIAIEVLEDEVKASSGDR